MKGSYWAKIVEADQQREQRMKSLYAKRKKYIDDRCNKCINRDTELCHITEDISGKMRCVNYRVEQNTIK